MQLLTQLICHFGSILADLLTLPITICVVVVVVTEERKVQIIQIINIAAVSDFNVAQTEFNYQICLLFFTCGTICCVNKGAQNLYDGINSMYTTSGTGGNTEIPYDKLMNEKLMW